MSKDTPKAPGTTVTRIRLQRLRELIALQSDPDWAPSYVREILDQDPDGPDPHCPRFAGLVEESGDGAIVVAETIAELADEVAARVTSDIPMSAIEMIDLDTQEHRQAHTTATVAFIVPGQPSTPVVGAGNARPEPPSQLALRVVIDEASDVAAERTVRAHYLGLEEISDTLGLDHEFEDSVITALQKGIPYSETAGEGERVYLIPAAAIPPVGPRPVMPCPCRRITVGQQLALL
jgi:hypothetical protein